MRNKFLLEKEIKELGFVFITHNDILYTINSLDMLDEDDFVAVTKGCHEKVFSYTDDFVIEGFED